MKSVIIETNDRCWLGCELQMPGRLANHLIMYIPPLGDGETPALQILVWRNSVTARRPPHRRPRRSPLHVVHEDALMIEAHPKTRHICHRHLDHLTRTRSCLISSIALRRGGGRPAMASPPLQPLSAHLFGIIPRPEVLLYCGDKHDRHGVSPRVTRWVGVYLWRAMLFVVAIRRSESMQHRALHVHLQRHTRSQWADRARVVQRL
jgi:hypothetical protein